jgi:ATP-dependent Zn protease
VGSAPRSRVLQNAVLTLLLVVMGLALLYAYRSQTPAVPEVDLTKALQEINAGQVKAVTIAGARATLEFRDVTRGKEQTTIPEPDTILGRAVTDYNAAHPSQQIELKYQADTQPLIVVGSVVLSLLPVLLIGGFFYYLMREARRRS